MKGDKNRSFLHQNVQNDKFDSLINPNQRYQPILTLEHLFPKKNGVCACGCGKALTGRKTKWAAPECSDRSYIKFAILKGDNGIIRKQIFLRDKGFCRECGVYDENWEVDHIIPVFLGGGACDLSNFQTLCPDCHRIKTLNQMESHRKEISSQAADNASMLLT